MKVYFVNFLLISACVVVLAAPQQPQQIGNIGMPYFGPFTSMFDLASLFPNSVLSTAENMVQSIPIVNLLPVAIESGMHVCETIAKNMDSRLTGLEAGRGVPHIPQTNNEYYGQTGNGQPSVWPPNFPNPPTNEFSPAVPASPPFAVQPRAVPAMPAIPAMSAVFAPPAMPAYDKLYQVNAESNSPSTKPSNAHNKEEHTVEHGHKTVKSSKKTVHKH